MSEPRDADGLRIDSVSGPPPARYGLIGTTRDHMPTRVDPEFGFESFASHGFYRAINRSLIETALRHAPVADRGRPLAVLDMACGTGLITSILAEVLADQGRTATVIAVDPDEGALAVARERVGDLGIPVRFACGSTSELAPLASNIDVAFFCNAIHLVSDKKAAIAQIAATLSPEGVLACNTSFFHGTYVEGTERFYRLWTRKALAWLKKEHPEVRLSRDEKAVAMQWLRPDEYTELMLGVGLSANTRLETADMPLDAWRDLGRYRLFIEGALPGAPLPLGSAALGAAVYEVGRELSLEVVPRRWLQLVAGRALKS
jgi:ubiquinone/menaquinone biosynthesis C-methylase UbiE